MGKACDVLAGKMHPKDRRYTKDHEWVVLQSETQVAVGITDYAQGQLGDVVFLDLPEPGTRLTQFQKLGEIESVKAVSYLYSPVGGEVVEVNQEVLDHPELVNEDPYAKGWMVRLASVNPDEFQNLMSAEQYEEFLAQLE